MGGTTFDHYAPGVDVNDAFTRAREEAGHEHGHGGYTGTIAEKGEFVVITRTPLLESEAGALMDRLISADDHRIRDKWGPAGAIPVVKGTRQADANGFEYVHDSAFYEPGKIQPELLAAVEPLLKLKKGETIQSIHVSTYEQPNDRPAGHSRGYGGSFTRSTKSTRSKCRATVTINKPPSTRVAPISITIPGGLNYGQKDKEIEAQVEKMRLKQGESVINFRVTKDTPGPAKVVAVAPKGATLTRFVIKGSMEHDTWETGFDSQAEARAWATEYMSDESRPFHLDNGFLEVEGITRRVDGQALVRVTREVSKRMVDVDVEVKLATASAPGSPDGWLFFGWASC